jgi:methylated-DNA-[protein]-cysteine S-methyltransferase
MKKNTVISFLDISTPAGNLRLEASGKGLRSVQWISRTCYSQSGNPVLTRAAKQIREYFHKTRTRFQLPLDPIGTSFQKKVWNACSKISFGKTITYKQLALLSGLPKAIRAAGGAMAANPLPVLVPCHRVVATSGRMGGYSGGKGIQTKLFLLKHEGVILARSSLSRQSRKAEVKRQKVKGRKTSISQPVFIETSFPPLAESRLRR